MTGHGITLDIVRSTTDRICYILLPERFLIGISLSGLFAIWSAFRCDLFDAVASVSGSLWYDGFASWTEGQPLSERGRKVSVLLGDREKKSRANTTHFSPVVPRLEKALASLSGEAEKPLKIAENTI